MGAQIYPKNRVSWVRAASARRKGHVFLSDATKSARLGFSNSHKDTLWPAAALPLMAPSATVTL